MSDSKVWVSTSTISSILHPGETAAKKSSRLQQHVRGAYKLIDWGWTCANILSTASDGCVTEDGKGAILIEIDDIESEYHKKQVIIPQCVVESGNTVVMANYHGADDNDGGGSTAIIGDDEDDSAPPTQNNNNGEQQQTQQQSYPSDLITLTHLHEPAVVHCLRKRYERDMIYTNTGPILIALNPFKKCGHLYNDAIMKLYWERGEMLDSMDKEASLMTKLTNTKGDEKDEEEKKQEEVYMEEDSVTSLAPHAYELADATYRSMMSKVQESGGDPTAVVGCDRKLSLNSEKLSQFHSYCLFCLRLCVAYRLIHSILLFDFIPLLCYIHAI